MKHTFPSFGFLSASLALAAAIVFGVSCREDEDAAAAPPPASAIPGTTYVMEMKGIVCGGCMIEVKDALAQLAGVPDEAVTFQRGSRPETRKVLFTADCATLTQDQVADALGEDARARLVIEAFAAADTKPPSS